MRISDWSSDVCSSDLTGCRRKSKACAKSKSRGKEMSWGSPAFVIAVIAMSYAAWLITSWIRAKHGYPIEIDWGGLTEQSESSDAGRQIELLSTEDAGHTVPCTRRAKRLELQAPNATP